MKIIAFYLPQFHNIPENNEWWGDGFTEWVNVKKAVPLYEGHEQPRIPLDDNYYNLLDDNVKVWQSKLAKKYGIYGFCYYHYWFNGKLLLEKPMEQMLANKEIDLPFCISWANEAWTKAWVNEETKVLIPQKYGVKKEWKEHFEYLVPFFKDDRYIKENNKPLFIIYRPEVISCLNPMLKYWKQLAIVHGFDGIEFAYQSLAFEELEDRDDRYFKYEIEFQPTYARNDLTVSKYSHIKKFRKRVARLVERKSGIDLLRFGWSALSKMAKSNIISYDDAWNAILKRVPDSTKSVPGAFVGWDNSPRHGNRARIFVGDTPEKFKNYMSKQIKRAKRIYHKDMIFLYAWNEWAEGGYLEPDTRNGYKYLEAIRDALKENGEFPWESN